MVIDTSAIIAILFDEPERASFNERIAAAGTRMMSMVSYVEAAVVMLRRKQDAGLADLETFLRDADIVQVSVDRRQAELAIEAYRKFGKGRHRAGLNIGDCFAYALAKATGEPLLFKGDDFGRTDIALVPGGGAP
jgi:ribonuclease VapC